MPTSVSTPELLAEAVKRAYNGAIAAEQIPARLAIIIEQMTGATAQVRPLDSIDDAEALAVMEWLAKKYPQTRRGRAAVEGKPASAVAEAPSPPAAVAEPPAALERVAPAPLTEAPAGDQMPVFALFERALDRGAEGAGALETLYKLYDSERDRSARLAFSRALARFQSQVPPVPRSSKAKITTNGGGYYEYTYADFEQVVETIAPFLRDNGLSFSFDSEADGNGTLRCICKLRHVEGHSESSSFALPTATKSAMSAQQAVGAALTFAKRQALIAVLGLALCDVDPDGAADPTTITESQAADLKALIDEAGANLKKVLQFAGVESVEQIRASDHRRVVAAVEAYRKTAVAKKPGGAK
jgi:hypothetical protein